ncbi:hypothetical protein XENOCAPTIV_025103, partial [Xenoophorus captivus]
LKLSGRDVSRAEPVDVWSKAGEIHVHHEAEKLCYAMSDFSVFSGLFNTGLNHHVSGLWTHISGLNQSVIQHGGILDLIQKSQDNIHSRMKNLNSSLNQVLQSFSDQTGEPLLCSYSLLVFGSDGPASLPYCLFSNSPKGEPGMFSWTVNCSSMFRQPSSCFSACFSVSSGIFTAPVNGHYHFSAVLTGHKNEKIEAVLAKSNYSMTRVDSGGYQPEDLEAKPVAESKISTGSLAVFSIVLSLQRGDTVCIDLVRGKLPHSVEPLTIFNGILLYEDL